MIGITSNGLIGIVNQGKTKICYAAPETQKPRKVRFLEAIGN